MKQQGSLGDLCSVESRDRESSFSSLLTFVALPYRMLLDTRTGVMYLHIVHLLSTASAT